nr:unnamed protein product [Callosobruchus analis]
MYVISIIKLFQDQKVNLSEFIETEEVYEQYCKINTIKGWNPHEPGASLKKFFNTACRALVSNNEKLWKLALRTISENPRVGPITEWFYHFGYFLLMKDISTMSLRALYLIETLENSPLSSTLVSIKQLNLLVRLILQRILFSAKELLKPLCSVLATLCLREPLREMTINKINQKLSGLNEKHALSLLTIIYFLGIEAILNIFLPNLNKFLQHITGCNEQDMIYILMGIYGQICRANLNNTHVQSSFVEILGGRLTILWKPFHRKDVIDMKQEINFVPMKTQLIKTRRKVDVEIRRGVLKPLLDNVFDIPEEECKVKKFIDDHRKGLKTYKKETHIIVGKTTLLLSVLKSNPRRLKYSCSGHSLLAFNF